MSEFWSRQYDELNAPTEHNMRIHPSQLPDAVFAKRKGTPMKEQPPFDASVLQDEIESGMREINEQRGYEPVTRLPAPNYRQEEPEPLPAPNPMQMTGELVKSQYEALAISVEALRQPLIEWADYAQQIQEQLHAAMKYIDDTAKDFRDKGQAAHEHLKKASTAILNAKKTCDEARAEVESPT